MEPADRELLVRIDERTQATHDMVEKHIVRDEEVQDQMFSKMNRTERRVNWIMGLGSGVPIIGGVVAGVITWLRSLNSGGV